MEKLALHFGAGNIGRGFIAPVLQENNFRVIFVDIDENLISKINREKKYEISYINSKKDGLWIEWMEDGLKFAEIFYKNGIATHLTNCIVEICP